MVFNSIQLQLPTTSTPKITSHLDVLIVAFSQCAVDRIFYHMMCSQVCLLRGNCASGSLRSIVYV